MPESDLLVTKFTLPPDRANLLQRSRLLDMLDQHCSLPLILLSASAGFGKTTLLTSWLNRRKHGHKAWLALDAQDNDPVRFWNYLIAALRKAHVSIGATTEALLAASQPTLLTSALTALVNELAAFPHDIFLVLDDYHLIREQTIHDGLLFVLEHPPHNLHLLLSCRADPALPLARLRARGQVLELREADLRLQNAEATSFLRQVMGLALTDEAIGHLETRTEGWITGLQLAALSLRRHTDPSAFLQMFTGSHRFILDYVHEEILAPLPEDQQRFLLYTSVLTRLDAEVCQVLTGEAASQQLLEELERANLFLLPLDEGRHWYRFHTLFREVLLAHLQATQPEQKARLHREAALWYRQRGELHEAIPHALATQDFPFVAALLEDCVEHLSLRGELNTLLAWIKRLPVEVLAVHPRLATTYLLVFNLLFPFAQQGQEERAYLLQLQEGVELLLQNADHTGLPAAERIRLQRRITILDAWKQARKALSSGDMALVKEFAEHTQSLELDDDALWEQHGLAPFAMAWRMAGNFPPLVVAIQKLKLRSRERSQEAHILWGLMAAHIALGQLQEASICCQELQQLINDLKIPLPLSAYPDLFQAQLAYAWNKLEAAQNAAYRAIHETTPLHYMDILMGAYDVLVRSSIAREDLTTAAQALIEMEQLNQVSDIPLFRPWIESLQLELWLASGQQAYAAEWVEHCPYVEEALTCSVFSRESIYVALVRVYLAQQRYVQALQLLAALLASAEQVSRMGSVVSFLALQVVALHASGARQDAQHNLARLLALAQPEGYIRVFLDAGEPMRQALQIWLATERGTATLVLTSYAHEVFNAFARKPSPPDVSQPDTVSPLLEPLTPREQEVLHLLAEGMTNQEIAERLIVSLTTVKKHVAALFLKLAAENRTHAVARARELSLL